MTILEAPRFSLGPFMDGLSILDKQSNVIPFRPNWAQQQIISQVEQDMADRKPTRAIVLKARQLGVSTVTEAIIFAMSVTRPNSQSAIISFDRAQAEYLFSMTKRFYETWPLRGAVPTRYSTKRSITFDGLDSHIWVMTGERPDAVRGRTYSMAHVSEVAMINDPVSLMVALNAGMPKVPGNLQFIESTAKGIGTWFHDAWIEAVEGRSGYTPFFFPWFKHYEYIPCSGALCTDATCDVCVRMAKGIKPVDGEEKDLVRLGASKANLSWRRVVLAQDFNGNLDWFHQEFPHTPEVAFIASGVNAFAKPYLDAVYEKQEPEYGTLSVESGEVKWRKDPAGAIRMYKHPSDDKSWGQYFIGADPSFGSVDGDFAAAQVISRRNGEQMAVWHGRIEPGHFADELALLGKYYNMAPIAPEIEGGGLATLERLKVIYPRIWQNRMADRMPGRDRSDVLLGWQTSWKTKALLILKTSEIVQRGKVIIHDKQTYDEMLRYQYLGGKGYTDRFGTSSERDHDDLVMSLAIALHCESTEPKLTAYEVVENPMGLIYGEKDEEGPVWE